MAEEAYVFDLRKITILYKGVWCQYPFTLNQESTIIEVRIALEKNLNTLGISF